MENIQDWVIKHGRYPNPSTAQFSATEVAYLIVEYNKQKLSGKI